MNRINKPMDIIRNENGSALVIAVLILAAVIIVGVFATNNTTTELQIAGGDLQMKMAFYEADGGTEYGAQLLEDNIACFGFNPEQTNPLEIGNITVDDRDFWRNATEDQVAFYFSEDAGALPRTDLEVNLTNTTFLEGGAIQMAAGYEGIGKSAGAGGAVMAYEIISERQKTQGSAARITVMWRHVVGREDDCRYR